MPVREKQKGRDVGIRVKLVAEPDVILLARTLARGASVFARGNAGNNGLARIALRVMATGSSIGVGVVQTARLGLGW